MGAPRSPLSSCHGLLVSETMHGVKVEVLGRGPQADGDAFRAPKRSPPGTSHVHASYIGPSSDAVMDI